MKELVELSHLEISSMIPNFPSTSTHYDFEIETNNKFGWNVDHAEIDISNEIIDSFKLLSNDGICICHAEKQRNKSLVYWCVEYQMRDLDYSPDMFEPNPVGFLEYYYDIKGKISLFESEFNLPVVIYKKRENGSLAEIRYSLNYNKQHCKPLIVIQIDKEGYLFTLTDNQDYSLKHIVYPTPLWSGDYLLQKFGKNSGDNIYERKLIENLTEKVLIFKGINEYRIKCLVDNELEKHFYTYGFFQNELRAIVNNADIILSFIPTINYHLIKPCNMSCKHCFSEFGEVDIKSLNNDKAYQIIDEICKVPSVRKINFSGGEPTLYKGIEKLIEYAKNRGFETSLVTNAFLLTQKEDIKRQLFENLDLIAFSIDSFENELNLEIGRSVGDKTLSFEDILVLAEFCHEKNVKIKVNTVVTKLNFDSLLAEKIALLKPIRWKILRMLPVENQNSNAFDLIPTDEDFRCFIENNVKMAENNGVKVVAEDNFEMRGSYLMISPDGRFFNNANNTLNYSDNILDVGIFEALSQTPLLREIFYKREGNYSCE